ncbi:acyl-CoA dehydrogenase family protein [Candidatus Leptofilum sp.]|uniref:acyl-CoA dehydrogenase family protein n=1 Tax=Candidatus Leptofilum sp. TaxID=3241576 RepID=UPI003B59D2D2
MLDFRLDEEQQMLTEAIARYASERMRKVFRDAEEDGRIPPEVVQAGWELGILPTGLPEAYGGFGEYTALTGVLASEELAWGDLAIALNVMVPNLVAIPVMLTGTEAQKEAYLPQFCDEAMPAMTAALTEPVVKFDPYKLMTTAVRDGDDYVLNGTKTAVPLAETAELILVYANEDGQTQAFLVPTDAPGLTIDKKAKLMGIKGLPTSLVTLADCRIPAANKLGGEDGINFGLILNHSRVALGAAAVGVARAGYEYALDYAKQRVQFGEPIAHKQSIAFMLADMATDIDEARLLVWETAWQMDRGEDVTRDAALMKQRVDDVVVQVADRALQILGGYGYIREYPVELWLRNARGFVSFDGLAIV